MTTVVVNPHLKLGNVVRAGLGEGDPVRGAFCNAQPEIVAHHLVVCTSRWRLGHPKKKKKKKKKE